MIREYIVLDAPSNLGLRPPMPNQQPGVYKLADAIRNCNFLEKFLRLHGVVVVLHNHRAEFEYAAQMPLSSVSYYRAEVAAVVLPIEVFPDQNALLNKQ